MTKDTFVWGFAIAIFLLLFSIIFQVFFVLRKKYNQITFLHVYHHGGMVLAGYIVSKYMAGSHGTLLGIINSYVHVVMYTYYFLTSFKQELKNSFWWKKHITHIQLVSSGFTILTNFQFDKISVRFQAQFAILVIHFLNPLVFFECSYPRVLSFVGLTQNVFMLILFSDFYYKAYIRKRKN